MTKVKHYLNLTNGIEYAPELSSNGVDFNFIRIQSTWCEQKRWDDIIEDLDYNFLMDLALGNNVVVYDTSAHKNVSRAMYQGLKFIEFCLRKRWYNETIPAYVKACNCTDYFENEYLFLASRALKKIDYFNSFLNYEKQFGISYESKNTKIDGKKIIYRHLLYSSHEKIGSKIF